MELSIVRWIQTCVFIAVTHIAVADATQAAELRLAGLAKHQETGRDIYLGAIYTETSVASGSDILNASGNRKMDFRIAARRTSIRSVLGGILLQAEVATGKPPSSTVVEFANSVMANVQGSLYQGDSLAIVSSVNGSTLATLNGSQMAATGGKEVFNYFLLGWIGERGPSTAFRKDILAAEVDVSLRADYNASRADPQRIAAIAAWSGEAEALANVVTEPAAAPAKISAPAPQLASIKTTATPVAKVELPPVAPATDVTELSVKDPANMLARESSTPQLAALIPSAGMLEPTPEPSAAQAIDVIEYSQRLAGFNSTVFRLVNSKIRYPRAAIRRNIQGTLELDVTMSTSGAVTDVAIARSSGHSMLDDSALNAAQRAFSDPLASPIDSVAIAEYSEDGERLVIPVPVNFILTE